MAGINLDIGGRDRVSKHVDALNRKIDETTAKLGQVAQQSKVTERDGRRLWEQTRTPLEKYNTSLERAKKLLDQGKISQDTYRRATERANQKLREQTSIFGSRGVQQIASYASGLLSVTAAIGTIIQAFRGAKQAQDELMSELRGAAPGTAGLGEISGAYGGMRRTVGLMNQLRRSQGLTEERAQQLMFSVASAGAQSDLSFFASIAGPGGIANVEGLPKPIQSLQLGFPKMRREDLADMIVRAAEANPATAAALGQAAGGSAGLAAQVGVSPQELLAASAILASSTGTPEEGATQVRGIMSRMLTNPALRGGGLRGAVQGIRGMAPEKVAEVFPDRRALRGALTLGANLDKLASESAAIEAAGATDYARQVARRPLAVESQAREFALRRAEQTRRIENIPATTARMESQAQIEAVQAAVMRRGAQLANVRQYAAGMAGAAVQIFTDDPEAVSGAAGIMGGSPVGVGLSIVNILERIYGQNEQRAIAMPEN